jgi:protein-tyrosine phosphatase
MNVLFVCTGNASRSVMGEYLFRDYLAKQNVQNIRCFSAGTEAVEDLPASEDTIAVCKEIGVDVSPHRRRLLTKALVEESDWIVGMEQGHLEAALRLGAKKDQLYLLGGSIADPYHQPYEVFVATREKVRSSLEGLYQAIIESKR